MDEFVATLRGLATSTVSDAMDRLGIDGQCFGIKPLRTGFTVCGPAFTVRTIPTDEKGRSVGEYVDDVPPGHVIVLDNEGRLDATVWGELLTVTASRRALGGTVIHGVCRDTSSSLALDYPIFSRGTYMRTGKDRVEVAGYNVQCSLGSVPVLPGDFMLGDIDGLVRIPQSRVADVVAVATDIASVEAEIRGGVSAGLRLDEARRQFGYFDLQTRRR